LVKLSKRSIFQLGNGILHFIGLTFMYFSYIIQSMTTKNKTYKSVAAMVKYSSASKVFKKAVLQTLRERRIGKRLFAERCKKGLTEQQVARKMKCSVSHVFDIEHTVDDEQVLGNIRKYAEAIGFEGMRAVCRQSTLKKLKGKVLDLSYPDQDLVH
jgi:hypothetical protein